MLSIPTRLRYSTNGKLQDPSAKQFLTCVILGSRKSLHSVSTPSAVFHLTLLTRVCDQPGFLSRSLRYSDCSSGWLMVLDMLRSSVPFPYLKVFSLLPMTRGFKPFYSDSANGMHWPSFGRTRMNPLCSFSNPYGNLAINYVILNDTLVPHFAPMNYPRRLCNDRGGK